MLLEPILVVLLMASIVAVTWLALPDRKDAPHRLMPPKDAVILGAFAIASVALVSGYALLVPVAAGG